jgi:hypothetical protein
MCSFLHGPHHVTKPFPNHVNRIDPQCLACSGGSLNAEKSYGPIRIQEPTQNANQISIPLKYSAESLEKIPYLVTRRIVCIF